jgi:hypothetical protein
MSPTLDDRLGVYIITRLLPKLGVNCDWLLTTGEEIGESSAELFRTDKNYNWAFSFDRAGTDVVLYQYDHKALRKLLRKAGFRVAEGMFSDLSFLDIGCSGINFGCGYHDNHSPGAYAILSDVFTMVDRFTSFHRKHESVRLPYNPGYAMTGWRNYRRPAYQHCGRNGYSAYTDYGYSAYSGYPEKGEAYLNWRDECAVCGRILRDGCEIDTCTNCQQLSDDAQAYIDNGR